MDTIRWGIIGTGRITRAVARDFREVAGVELTAVASRTQQRADEWAQEFGLQKAYGSYRSLLDDEDIDVVYMPRRTRNTWTSRLPRSSAGRRCSSRRL